MTFAATPEGQSALPLCSLTAVVVDTETTGLDTATDRVIEIGAVRLDGGCVADPAGFATLVNPSVPIPEKATAIHGLSDTDIAGAPDFAPAMERFNAWAGPAVVIGYSIGFDIAILKSEHERAGLAWQAPRALDVRHLVQVLGPNLPEESLEMTAGWLGIEITDRHRALGDARLAAEVFLALVPKLRERNVTTLAEAERKCRSLTTRREEEARAGWHDVSAADGAGRAVIADYARIDSFAYRHRVAELMSAPPRIEDGTMPLNDALTIMVRDEVSSLFLKPAGSDGDHGIITERDVLRAVQSEGAAAFEQPIDRFGHRPLVTIDADEFAYRAMTLMVGRGFRHLGVAGPDNDLVGALSARDLLRQRAGDAVDLGRSIESAQSPAELGRVWSDLTAVVRALVLEEVDPRDIAAIASRELRALTRRAAELAEAELKEAGRGGPPVAYAVLVLGSGGRGESLLAMDQDNAIIFEAGEPDGAADQWFKALGQRVADMLNEAGVVYCKGGVMASNAEWRMDAAHWRNAVRSWITRSRPEDILNCDIFFDARPVHGDTAMADALRQDAMEIARSARTFLKFLSLNAGNVEVPTGWFGRFKLDQGRIDLKAGGIMPIFSAARVVALANGITARSTPERLDAARPLDIVPARTIDNLIEAHRLLLGFILEQQLRDIDEGVPLSNRVAPGDLAGFRKQQLTWALEQVPSVKDLLGTPAFG